MRNLAKPKHLPGHLVVIWDELCDQVIPTIGSHGMEAFCAQIYRMREAQKQITEEGIIVTDPKGNPVPHPAIPVEKQASAEVRAWISRYGK